jgi:hypothetical protein
MGTTQIILILVATGVFAGIMGMAMIIMLRMRESRYNTELKRVELELMRKSLEGDVYDATKRLVGSDDRWRDVNHLLIEAQRYARGEKKHHIGRNRFLHAMGVDAVNLEIDRKKVFVLTPFHPEFEGTFDIIADVCRKVGLECLRGDEEFLEGSVLKHIVTELCSAGIVIANIDGRNPNVYYELGLAHALEKPVLLVASDIEAIPFDLKSQRVVIFNKPSDLKRRLQRALTQLLVEEVG